MTHPAISQTACNLKEEGAALSNEGLLRSGETASTGFPEERRAPSEGAQRAWGRATLSILGAEHPVARIAESRHDVGVLIQALVQSRHVHRDFRVMLLEHRHAFGRGHQR